MAAWQNNAHIVGLKERFQQAKSDAAVAITITSVTNAVAFAVGMLAPIRAVRSFCLFTCMGFCFNFIYQVTFFAAMMYYNGKWQYERRHCLAPCKTVKNVESKPKLDKS